MAHTHTHTAALTFVLHSLSSRPLLADATSATPTADTPATMPASQPGGLVRKAAAPAPTTVITTAPGYWNSAPDSSPPAGWWVVACAGKAREGASVDVAVVQWGPMAQGHEHGCAGQVGEVHVGRKSMSCGPLG